MANQELTFDITKLGTQQEKQQYIVSRVGDGGLKAITISVTSNGTPYNITDLEPIFEGIKPDGEHIIDTTGGTVLDPKMECLDIFFHNKQVLLRVIINKHFSN